MSSARIALLLSLCLALVAGCSPAGSGGAVSGEFEIPYESYTLDNGLKVILHQDSSDPIVAMATVVHVGSNREVPGRTGFAHFFEHMSFNDSENVPAGANRKMIGELGGTRNGGTWSDGTIYYEVVPKDAFEKLMWIDSDRLGFMINTVHEAALENEKQVVKNEKRQRVDNQAYGHTDAVIRANLYPPDHPYNWTVIGSLDDLQAATLDDVKQFYERFYGANNATLVVAGDIDIEQTKAMVSKWFGEIRRGPEMEAMPPRPVTLQASKSLYHVDTFAKLPELRLTYPTVEQFHDDVDALDVLGTILSDGKRAPLYKTIVEERKLAPRASASNDSNEIAGSFTLRVRASAGVDLDEVKAAIDEALTRFEEEGFTDGELERIKAAQERQFYEGVSSVLGRAFQLAFYNEFAGDPSELMRSVDRIRAVTREDVMDVYARYIKGKPYIMTSFVPKGGEALIVEGAERAVVVEEKIIQGAEKQVAADPNFEYPRTETAFERVEPPLSAAPRVRVPEVWQAETKNGMRVLGIEHSELPLVAFTLRIRGGQFLDPLEKAGTAQLMGSLMMEGTKNRTPTELEDAIGELGADISISANREWLTISASTLARNYDAVVELVREMLLEPRWDATEFDRLKRSTLTGIKQREGNPNAVAQTVFNRLTYGDGHIFSRPVPGTEQAVNAIELDDLKAYYERNVSPSVAVFHVAGALDREQALAALGGLEKNWKAREVELPAYPTAEAPEKPELYFVDIPDSKQSVIFIGGLALRGSDDDYNNLSYANNRLGSGSSARLFQILRIQKGYTYGASSSIARRIEPAPFAAASSVRSNVTLESLQIFKEQIGGYADTFTEEDLETTKNLLIKQSTRRFETLGDLIGLLQNVSAFDLPTDYIERDQEELLALDLDSFHATIRRYMNEKRMRYIVVGDARTQRERLKELGYGSPVSLDIHGNPL